MKIENSIEADELIIALVARRNVWRARAREGKQNLEAEIAVNRLMDQAMAERRALLEQPKYRYLAVGEIVQRGDEIHRESAFEDRKWSPVRLTIGQKVRIDNCQDFRRPL